MSGTSWVLSPEKLRATKVAPDHQRHADEIDRRVAVGAADLALRALVGGGRELALGQAVHAVVLGDVDHVHAAAHAVHELAETDRRRVAVARDAHIDEVLVGEIGAGEHRRHAAVHAVEAVALAEQIVGRLGRAADARELGDAMRLDVELEAGLDDRGADRVVPAARAQGRDRALIVATREAELVLLELGMAEFRLGQIRHVDSFPHAALTPPLPLLSFSDARRSRSVMKRAVIGVPS